MGKKVDFLFLYEVKERELENICLLKYELEKRGYTVAIEHILHLTFNDIEKYTANVLIVSACYNDFIYDDYAQHANFKKIINMQWEQVILNVEAKNKNTIWYTKGKARNALHFSWGHSNVRRMVEFCKVPKENMFIVGQLALDFMRKPLLNYFKSKEEISKEYNIDEHSKICIFISSFSVIGRKNELEHLNAARDVYDHYAISVNTQETLVSWILKLAKENKDITFIYRPHPAETTNEKLQQKFEQFDNVKLIRDYSIKQWILISDKVYTWCSTAVVEAIAAKKDTYILRPFVLNDNYDLAILENAKTVNTYDDFACTIHEQQKEIPIDNNILNYHYFMDATFVYKKICDILERLLHSKGYKFPKANKIEWRPQKPTDADFKEMPLKQKLMVKLDLGPVGKMLIFLAKNTKWDNTVLNNRRKLIHGYKRRAMIDYNIERYKRMYVTPQEIDKITNKIKKIVEENK